MPTIKRLGLRLSAVIALTLLSGVFAVAQQRETHASKQDAVGKPCVLVYGAVASSGGFDVERPLRLSEVISLAGGATNIAVDVQVLHTKNLKCVLGQLKVVARSCIDCRAPLEPVPEISTYKLAAIKGEDDDVNPFVQPGESVAVLEAPRVYVVGNVVTPQGINMVPGLTLTRVIEIAGGMRKNSNKKKICIYRNGPTVSARTEIVVNLEAIKKRRAEDFILQPYDIIEVPEKRYEEKWWRPSRSGAYRYVEQPRSLDWTKLMLFPQGAVPIRLKQ